MTLILHSDLIFFFVIFNMKLSHIEEYALHVDTSGINDVVICFSMYFC